MSKGWARSVTRAAPFASRWTISRRVGSESAAKARSRTGGVIYSTYGLNIATGPPLSSDRRSDSDRKSTRLNSSHLVISYAVFCLTKNNQRDPARRRVEDAEHALRHAAKGTRGSADERDVCIRRAGHETDRHAEGRQQCVQLVGRV